MSQEEREQELLNKDITDLTPEDLEELRRMIEAGKIKQQKAEERINAIVIEIEKSVVNSVAFNVFKELSSEGAKEGAAAFIKAFNEYSKTHKGSIHELLSDPDLPEILQQIRELANAYLLELLEEDNKATTQTTPRPIRADKVEFPLDKINNRIWNLLEQETSGQIVFDLAGKAKVGEPAKAPAYYSINFDALDKSPELQNIVKRLTPYDKRVYQSIAGEYNAGNISMSLTEIYYSMGNTSRPNATQLSNVLKSIEKMMGAVITLDHSEKAAELGYTDYKHTSQLLPAVLDRGYRYNKEIKSKIQLRPLTEPPLLTYAKMRKEVTTLPVKLLQSPVNKTDANIAVEDYLLDAIAHAKRTAPGKNFKRLYSTICERTRQTSKKQRQRMPEKVQQFLDYYVKCNHIKSYQQEADGVIIQI